MTLRDLIARLEAEDQDLLCPRGFRNPHSYRGHYRELSFDPWPNVTVAEMLAAARSADGATYQGWKGGDYTMGLDTPCHFAPKGDCDDLGDVPEAQLEEMLAAGVVPDESESFAAGAVPEEIEEWTFGWGSTHGSVSKGVFWARKDGSRGTALISTGAPLNSMRITAPRFRRKSSTAFGRCGGRGMANATFDPSRDAPEPENDDSDLEDLEIVERWIIRSQADGKGYRATRMRELGDYRSLSVRLDSPGLRFESDECFNEDFPRAVVRRLFELLDSLEQDRAIADHLAGVMREIDEISDRVIADHEDDGGVDGNH
jgi:hypothetical protein